MCDSSVDWGSNVKVVKLSFNASESAFRIFSKSNKVTCLYLNLSLNGCDISPVDKCLYLGLVFYKHLSWRPHIAQKCLASKRLLFLMNKCFRLTWGLSKDKLLLVYRTVFIPQVPYGSFGRCQELLNPLRCYKCSLKKRSVITVVSNYTR